MNKERVKRYRQRRELRRLPEVLRGMKEAREGIATLQSLWPMAFPDKFQRVKPLASGIIPVIVERTGWSRSYARGVVHVWKASSAYSKAVLNFVTRFDLNGEPIDQAVENSARAGAAVARQKKGEENGSPRTGSSRRGHRDLEGVYEDRRKQ